MANQVEIKHHKFSFVTKKLTITSPANKALSFMRFAYPVSSNDRSRALEERGTCRRDKAETGLRGCPRTLYRREGQSMRTAYCRAEEINLKRSSIAARSASEFGIGRSADAFVNTVSKALT